MPTTAPLWGRDGPCTVDNAAVIRPDSPDVPLSSDPGAVAALRADLGPDGAGFTVDRVNDLLGPLATAALGREQPLPARLAVAEAAACDDADRRRLATLVGCFVLGTPQPAPAVDTALSRLGAAGAVRMGLLETVPGAEGTLRATVDLRPYATQDAAGEAHWWVVSDLGELATGGPLRTDHVLGVGGASVSLARTSPRPQVRRVLDLGTGCGVQALHASRHADHVTGTDLSARALAFARFTWRLNGLDDARLTLLQGDMFAPVAGLDFDLVVSNPPFVITPRGADVPAYDYRDGGREGDALVADFVRTVGRHVAPGGTVHLLANWEHRRDEGWRERVGAWLDASGLQGWVVQRDVQDPAEYAETWIRDGGTKPGPAFDRLYTAWLEDFDRRGVEAVGFGLITLQHLDGAAPQHRLEDLRGPVDGALGEHLLDTVRTDALLRATPTPDLMGWRLTVADDVMEERYYDPGADDPRVILLKQGGGYGRAVRAGTELAAFVGACDGQLTVGELLGALAQILEVTVDDLTGGLEASVRGLVRDGLLVRA